MIDAGVSADRAAGRDPHASLARYTAALASIPKDSPDREAAETFLAQFRAAVDARPDSK